MLLTENGAIGWDNLMAIDYTIDYACVPKETLGTDGIRERLKGKERADTIIALFRQDGDDRPPSEMGFEYTRSTPGGEEERRVMHVQTLLDAAEELTPQQTHCEGCPANRTGSPFGCFGFIQYPISHVSEKWLLNQLPVPDDALVWPLLKQGVQEFQYDGSSIRPLRSDGNNYFEEHYVLKQRLGSLEIDANQVFEMIFAVGNYILPNHGALLLLFFNAISRDVEARDIMEIAPATPESQAKHPLILEVAVETDDQTTAELKAFLHAMYIAWLLNVRLLIDA
jgi:hypothetical protein